MHLINQVNKWVKVRTEKLERKIRENKDVYYDWNNVTSLKFKIINSSLLFDRF